MAIPVLSLNLAPRPSIWRQHHLILGWVSLGAGLLVLLGALGLTWRAYRQANQAGRAAVSLTEETRRASSKEQQIQASLEQLDATREQSRWKLAERILMERSLPWSRLAAELEQCMVPDMRLKTIQRTRSSGQQVVMKIKGEARTREAETAFVESLQRTPVFTQVILEREAERTGGGWEFEMSLPTASIPPPFQVRVTRPGSSAVVQRAAAPPRTTSAPPPPLAKTVLSAPQPARPVPALRLSAPEVIEARPAPTQQRAVPRSGLARSRTRQTGAGREDKMDTP